jgi:hypothetical protein
MYLFTAGHCVSSSLDNSISADNSEDEKELVVINDNLDFAVLPLKKNSGIILQGLNPWYVRCVESIKRILGDDHPFTLSSINNLAGLFREEARQRNANKSSCCFML